MDKIEVDIVTYKRKIKGLQKYTKEMDVLFAEDYEPLYETLLQLFSSLFRTVDAAKDGEEAHSFYKDKLSKGESYGLVLSDIEMPKMNGVELVSKIKKLDKEQNCIVFSAYQDSHYLLELINLGVRRFILKPVSLVALLDELTLSFSDLYESSANKIDLSHHMVYNKHEKALYQKKQVLELSNYEQFIIELLIEKVNLTVSQDEIVNYLYFNNIDISLDNVRKRIYSLRQKLPENFIQSVHGIGYRIVIQEDN